MYVYICTYIYIYIYIYILETRHGQDDASTSLQIVRSKLVVMLIVFFFANRVVVACQIEPAKTQVSRTQQHQVDRAVSSSWPRSGYQWRQVGRVFCFAACVCYVCLFRFLARSLTASKDDQPAMPIALSPSSFFASQRVSVTAPNRRELCRSLADSLAKSNKNHRENRSKIISGDISGHPKLNENRFQGLI